MRRPRKSQHSPPYKPRAVSRSEGGPRRGVGDQREGDRGRIESRVTTASAGDSLFGISKLVRRPYKLDELRRFLSSIPHHGPQVQPPQEGRAAAGCSDAQRSGMSFFAIDGCHRLIQGPVNIEYALELSQHQAEDASRNTEGRAEDNTDITHRHLVDVRVLDNED